VGDADTLSMSLNPSEGPDWAARWDRLYEALSAEPRRMIIASLLDEPQGRRLPLPEAAESPNKPQDDETLRIELCHNHLPLLAEAGYVRWEQDPFVVQRGPRFEEPESIIEVLTDSLDALPPSLINNCKIFREQVNDD